MDNTMGQTGDELIGVDENTPELDWAVVKSLMDAQANTNTSLERYLLYVTHDEFDLDDQHIERCLSEAITHHERALEDLKVARELIAEDAD
ncbi:hypothetical protein [Halorubrum sp. SP9]|uniref:hypothetical protein n=1 Tax=Halorubrum sp. SP9 TaxID=1537267 RepID=UPI0010F800F3|nr:hypothetical protein [Halorubrum sp. SP9]TKX68971.1 hypothetical protein EXE45_09920 [Halorubrum sp. SP9]